MTNLRKNLPVIAAVLIAVLFGLHAASATVVAAGTASPLLASVDIDEETGALEPEMPMTLVALAFFMGYFAGDVMCHWGRSDSLPASGIQDKAFDF
jgi:hypothetical protein